jgi:hypothetical protein
MEPHTQASLEHIRLALQRAAERRSMRRVADEVGISLGGIHKVIHGATPRAGNYRRLLRWYLAQEHEPDQPTADEVRDIAWLLLGDLRDEALTGAFLRVIAANVELAYTARGLAPPGWVAEVAARPPASG